MLSRCEEDDGLIQTRKEWNALKTMKT